MITEVSELKNLILDAGYWMRNIHPLFKIYNFGDYPVSTSLELTLLTDIQYPVSTSLKLTLLSNIQYPLPQNSLALNLTNKAPTNCPGHLL